ncbi:MAG: FxsA family protein [Acidimicrobiales bacterium]
MGVLPAILAQVVISASGPWLVRRAGFGVWRRTREGLAAGEVPGREVLDGVVLLAGGVLVCIPGFVTDVVGLLLLLPPARSLAGRIVGRRLARRAARLSNTVIRSSAGGATTRTGWDGLAQGPVLDIDSPLADGQRPPLTPGDPPPEP